MKQITPPPDASINVQKAVSGLQQNIEEVAASTSDVIRREEFEQALDEIRIAVGIAGRKKELDINDTFRGGDSHAHGYVPDPDPSLPGSYVLSSAGEWAPPLDGALRGVPPGRAGTSLDQKVVNVFGSLAVVGGGVSAENVRTRNEQVVQDVTVGGNASIAGNATIGGTISLPTPSGIAASQVSTTPSDGATGFLAGTDVQSNLSELDTEPLIQVTPQGACGTSLAQRIAQVNGSLNILGSVNANRVECGFPNSRVIGVSVTHSSNTSCANGASQLISFNTTLFDSHGFHSDTVNSSRITIPAGLGGFYLVTASARWADINDLDGYRQLVIEKNVDGTTNVAGIVIDSIICQGSTGGDPVQNLALGVIYLAAGDRIEVFGVQTSGSSINLVSFTGTTADGVSPVFTAIRLGW